MNPERPPSIALPARTFSSRAAAQSAMRDGDWKYLKIRNNEYLLDLARDERKGQSLAHLA